jgi:hypothetical protein
MPSTPRPARAALVVLSALLTLGPPSVGRLRAADAGESPPATTAALADVSIDPLTAAGDEIVSTLHELDDTVSALAAEAAAAAAARKEAAAELEAAESERAEAEGRAAAAARPRFTGTAVVDAEHPSTGAFVLWDAPAPLRAAGGAGDAGAAAELDEAARNASEMARAAARREALAEAAAAALAEAEDAEVAFVASVEERVGEHLAEAETMAERDPDSAEVMREEEAVVADAVDAVVTAMEEREAAEEPVPSAARPEARKPETPAPPAPAPAPPAPAPPAPAPLPDPTGSASGALAGPWCPDGRQIVVDSSIGGSVQALLNDAHAAGVDLCAKSGFRTYAEQVELRRANCGASEHGIFQAPSSSCSPPTARPGTSNHEDGLAVDFSCSDGQPMTHASPCYQWLAANAAAYGLFNLPSEPWHWSVTGR